METILTNRLQFSKWPGTDQTSKFILKHHDVKCIVTKSIVDIDGDAYRIGDAEWDDGIKSNILYEPVNESLQQPPIIVEVQTTVDAEFMNRAVHYCVMAYRATKSYPGCSFLPLTPQLYLQTICIDQMSFVVYLCPANIGRKNTIWSTSPVLPLSLSIFMNHFKHCQCFYSINRLVFWKAIHGRIQQCDDYFKSREMLCSNPLNAKRSFWMQSPMFAMPASNIMNKYWTL